MAWLRPEIDASGWVTGGGVIYLKVQVMVQVRELCNWHHPAREDFKHLEVAGSFRVDVLNGHAFLDDWIINSIDDLAISIGEALLKEPDANKLRRLVTMPPDTSEEEYDIAMTDLTEQAKKRGN